MVEHPYCEEGRVLRGHGEDIAVLEAKVQDLERVKTELFKQTKEIGDTAVENKFVVNYIKTKIDNGELTRPIERKIDQLCGEFSKTRNSVETHNKNIVERVERLEKSSWVTDILGVGFKKLLVAAVIGALILGLANTALWGIAKTYIFKEAPMQQRFMYLQQKEGAPAVISSQPLPDSVPIPVKNGNNNEGNNKK